MKLKVLFFFLGNVTWLFGQNLEQIGKVPLIRYNGGISANSIYYEGEANREPFTYFINGNLNINISGVYDIPLSFSYTNQDFGYSTPFKINRLSLHPSYKWITTHIGDAAMTFSPYTLNGHQFTGGGIELAPPGAFKISAFYGKLLRATEYDENNPNAIPAYERWGYGFKTAYDFDNWDVGLIFLKAKDQQNSIESTFPAELELAPKENAVVSAQSGFTLFKKAKIAFEYALSGVTEDIRSSEQKEDQGILSLLLNENLTTNYYNALNMQFSYPAGSGTVGAGYERVDPEYRTFGAYFFNNDLENITVNASQNIFNNKVSLSVNAGLQRDNLDNTKSSELQRIVSSFNAGYTASDKLSFNTGYSNFQSYTNIRNQFDYINEVQPLENIDTLNYRQISQNANLGINYTLAQTKIKQKSATFNVSYQGSDNQQNEETVENGLSNFYNITSAYTIGYLKRNLNLSIAANASYNTIGATKALTWRPTVSITKSFLDKKLRTQVSTSYNTASTDGEKINDIVNMRAGGSYTFYESHNLSLNLLSLYRNTALQNTIDFTATLGYSYAFDTFKFKLKQRQREQREISDTNVTVQFRYRSAVYSGTLPEVRKQLNDVKNSSRFQNIPQSKSKEVSFLYTILQKEEKPELFKKEAIAFLEALYSFEDFLKQYDQLFTDVVLHLKADMQNIDYNLETMLIRSKIQLDELKIVENKDLKSIETKEKEVENRQIKLMGHRWMKRHFDQYDETSVLKNEHPLLASYKKQMAEKIYEMIQEGADVKKINVTLEAELIEFYHTRSLNEQNPEDLDFKYLNKN